MRYSFEFKLKSVDLYKQGKWAPCTDGIKNIQYFHRMVRDWARAVDANGSEVLKHNNFNRTWTPEERYELVAKVIAGESRNDELVRLRAENTYIKVENEVIKKEIALRRALFL